MNEKELDDTFIHHAADILGDTSEGLSGSEIVKYCISYGYDFDVSIPITNVNFKIYKDVPNKRTALYKNLVMFNAVQQFTIIKELSENPKVNRNENVKELKNRLIARFPQYSYEECYLEKYDPTGWERVDRVIEEMNKRLEVADTEEKFQAIGMLGRETLITIAQQVFDSKKHPTTDDIETSKTDAKRMLEAYINYELKKSSDRPKKYIRSAVDLSNHLTHDRCASKREASMCIIGVISIAQLVKAIQQTEANSTDLQF